MSKSLTNPGVSNSSTQRWRCLDLSPTKINLDLAASFLLKASVAGYTLQGQEVTALLSSPLTHLRYPPSPHLYLPFGVCSEAESVTGHWAFPRDPNLGALVHPLDIVPLFP